MSDLGDKYNLRNDQPKLEDISPMGAPANLPKEFWDDWDRKWSEDDQNCVRAFLKQSSALSKLAMEKSLAAKAALMTKYREK
jgi:hypothetical protein